MTINEVITEAAKLGGWYFEVAPHGRAIRRTGPDFVPQCPIHSAAEQIGDPSWPEATTDPLDELFGLDAWLLRRASLVDEGMEVDLC